MDFSQIGLIIFNIITPSIPEQIFYIYFTLYLFGKAEEIKLRSDNIVKISALSAVIATISVLLRTFFPDLAQSGMLLIIGLVITCGSFIVAYRISGIKEIFRSFVCMIISFIIGSIFQTIYIPLLLYGTNTGIEELYKPGIMPFIWSLPELAMIFSVISILTVRKSINLRARFLIIVSRNKVVLAISIALLLFNILFLAVMIRLICFDKILLSLSFLNQLLFIVIVVIFPVLNVSLLMVALYSNYYRETIRVLLSKDRINTLVNILEIYAEEKKYDKIEGIVNDLHKQVHYI